ncbi:MAG TPA: phosphotransferase family protein, partial [Acetobacteraceae bacterium]|nr:phosphotransferase family protein [Acetobacteraceae bacterium]
MPTLDAHLPALERWMQHNVRGYRGPIEVQPFEGGQSNPTCQLTAASGAYVLRRRPLGTLLPSAHAVDREYRVQRALAGSRVPVPHLHGYCDDVAVIGSAFYVMDHVPGRIFFDPRLPGLDAAQRRAMFAQMNDVIAALHGVDWRAAGLDGFGRPGGFLARQVARWTQQYRASATVPIEAMDRLIAWLPAHLPTADEVSLVHGDYRMDNLIFHPVEPRIVAVLDWELSTIGDPLADFGYHAIAWRIAPELFRGVTGSDLGALGIPGEQEYLAA